MNNQNIQIGIDLGTTNSEVAANNKGQTEVVKNIFNDEYTPSVFGVDKSKNKVVGKRAYERLYKDASEKEFSNNKAEIKRLMGTSDTVHFDRLDEDMTPEEISGEILKTLKEDVLRKYPGTPTTGVVITIPAYFSTLQAEATKRAGNIAGFKYVVLIQEPIAAAISYGFMNAQNENWLVYDLGGGTFDVALISSKDGALSVLGHNGDNFLGGKDFDWVIVDKVIVPAILEKYKIEDFTRGSKKYRSIFAKLKYYAESAKITLSQVDNITIEVDKIGEDDDGKEIYLTIPFNRKDFEKLIKPFVDKTIELSRETIVESGVKQSSITRIVFVGGPTMIPYIKERLEKDLKLEVDTSSDPLTVVARGACIYATSQKIPKEFLESKKATDSSIKTLRLNYESLTAETEEILTGVIEDLAEAGEDYFIQIQSEGGLFSGKKIKLKNGKFIETVNLDKNKTTLFWIYLFDAEGNPIKTEPESFSITHGLSVSGAPISYSIGVGVVKRGFSGASFAMSEEFEVIFEKNSVLPLKTTRTYKTLKPLVKGDKENALPIKIREGESNIPDQNQFICDLKVTGENIPYDLPEGTEISLTIEVNESREVKVEAFIPSIDLSFIGPRATIYAEDLSIEEMETQLKEQSDRAKKIEQSCTSEEKGKLQNLVQSLKSSLATAKSDEDEKRKSDKQLKDLKIRLDGLEKMKEFPQLKSEYEEKIKNVEEIIDEWSDQKEKTMYQDQLRVIKEEADLAVSKEDKVMLSRSLEQLEELNHKALFSNPASWVYMFNKIKETSHAWTSPKEAEYYMNKGQRALELGDVEELKRSVHNLMLLLPPSEQKMIQGNMSGITE
jgi:molecular chaperone DnaK